MGIGLAGFDSELAGIKALVFGALAA